MKMVGNIFLINGPRESSSYHNLMGWERERKGESTFSSVYIQESKHHHQSIFHFIWIFQDVDWIDLIDMDKVVVDMESLPIVNPDKNTVFPSHDSSLRKKHVTTKWNRWKRKTWLELACLACVVLDFLFSWTCDVQTQTFNIKTRFLSVPFLILEVGPPGHVQLCLFLSRSLQYLYHLVSVLTQ